MSPPATRGRSGQLRPIPSMTTFTAAHCARYRSVAMVRQPPYAGRSGKLRLRQQAYVSWLSARTMGSFGQHAAHHYQTKPGTPGACGRWSCQALICPTVGLELDRSGTFALRNQTAIQASESQMAADHRTTNTTVDPARTAMTRIFRGIQLGRLPPRCPGVEPNAIEYGADSQFVDFCFNAVRRWPVEPHIGKSPE